MSSRVTRSMKKETDSPKIIPAATEQDSSSVFEEGDAINEIKPLKRRTSSIFSLEIDHTPLDPPDEADIKKFTSDDIHFSLVRNLHMADFITLLNGFCGFYSIVSCLRFTLTGLPHYVQRAHIFIVLGLFFDFFDGRVARLRNKSSLMGQELDSLADLISFGVAPASIAFAIGFQSTIDVLVLTARFNVTVTTIPKDLTGKSKYFEGLPIPTSLFVVGVMAYLVHHDLVGEALPLGLLFPETAFEFHPLVLGFGIHGCGFISKSLKIPKP
ncbi:hypothetical protein WICPIJ_008757 [Wickerhamomyces pijperi]|uniref:CDP-diacylglycerol--serine O-phosphatidyltransferase n=1 Tax=Wickerhamomyces pijperi TaxID=599730 RepID=A0A9P8PX72_WICPI|nr:hypothetical protein WICPIJ_008757 [Wickerhamomyces pijperi]